MKTLVEVNNGMLTTNTWLISKAINRRHSDVMTDLKAEVELGQVDVRDFSHISVKDKYGREQEAIELTESGFLSVMPYICGTKGREGQRALVKEFIRLRKEADIQYYFIDMTDDEQASTCGRGLANRRWGKPVFDLQFCLALDNPNDPARIESN